MWGPAKVAALISLPALLALPSGAAATVTIGSDLGRAPTIANSCGPSCTIATTSLPFADQAAGGLTSPVNGTVVSWQVRIGATTSQTTFRVMRLLNAAGLATASASSATVTPPVNATTAFSTQLPIHIGDTVGIDCCSSSGSQVLASTPTAVTQLWNPRLIDGAPERPPLSGLAFEVPVNAVIEPTSTFTVSQVKARKGGKLKVAMVAPNAGTLVATGKGLHSTTTPVPAAGPLTLVVKPYFVSKRKLADGKKVKAKLKLAFTPTGGNAAVQAFKVKLKS